MSFVSVAFFFFWLDLDGREEGDRSCPIAGICFYGIEQYPSFERLIYFTYVTVFEL